MMPEPNYRWRGLALANWPLTPRRAEVAIHRAGMSFVCLCAAVGLWYFWDVRPLWVSLALLTGYAGLAIYLARRSWR